MAGEFALQTGRLDLAAGHYLDAARAHGQDTVVSERATRLALLANEPALAGEGLALWQAQSPHAIGARAAAAVLALRRDDAAAARPLLADLLADPDPEAGKAAAGALLSAGGHDATVARVLEALVDAGQLPARPEVWQDLGAVVVRLEDAGLTRKMIAAAVRQFPDEPRVRILQARQLARDGNPAGALAVLAPLHARAVADAQVRNLLAAQYEAMGEWKLGAQVMGLGPQDAQTHALRAAFLVRGQDKAGLAALYAQLARTPGRSEPAHRLLLGKMAEYLGQTERALAWYRGVGAGRERGEALFRTVLLLDRSGRYPQAVAAAQAMQADVRLDGNQRRDAYLLEAELHDRAGRSGDRLQALNRGLAAFADEPALLYARGLYWEQAGDTGRAEADLRQLLAAEPDNAAALNALGYLLADHTDRYQEALELILRALVAEPDNPAIIDSHGWVLFRLGRLAEAEAALRRAWSLQHDAEIGAHLAEVLLALGRKEEARAMLGRAEAVDPQHHLVQALRERLRP